MQAYRVQLQGAEFGPRVPGVVRFGGRRLSTYSRKEGASQHGGTFPGEKKRCLLVRQTLDPVDSWLDQWNPQTCPRGHPRGHPEIFLSASLLGGGPLGVFEERSTPSDPWTADQLTPRSSADPQVVLHTVMYHGTLLRCASEDRVSGLQSSDGPRGLAHEILKALV